MNDNTSIAVIAMLDLLELEAEVLVEACLRVQRQKRRMKHGQESPHDAWPYECPCVVETGVAASSTSMEKQIRS